MYSRRNFLKTTAPSTAGLLWLSLQDGIYATSAQAGQDGWCNALIHQLYPHSFADTHGNAIGDIAGEAVVNDYAPRNALGRHLTLQPSPGTPMA